MALRTSVKVGSITNLSDARYCAGMGVDWLGFRTMGNQEKYISPELFKEIFGWFAGPKVIAEVYGIQTQQQLEKVLADYQPEFIELSLKEFSVLQTLTHPTILSVTYSEFQQQKEIILKQKDRVEYLLVSSETDPAHIIELTKEFSVLVKMSNQFKPELLELPIHGIALDGSSEEKPGLKSYEALANVLELLEVD